MKINLKINSSKLWLNKFPWKKRSDHKYSRGKLVIFGSQLNMIGSTILSSEAALRVGTGSVKIICSKKTLPIYSLKFPSVLKEKIDNLNLLIEKKDYKISLLIAKTLSNTQKKFFKGNYKHNNALSAFKPSSDFIEMLKKNIGELKICQHLQLFFYYNFLFFF